MSLVTAQGMQAQGQLDREAKALSQEIQAFLRTGEKSFAQIQSNSPGHSEDIIREAIWLLIDSGDAHLTTMREVALTGRSAA